MSTPRTPSTGPVVGAPPPLCDRTPGGPLNVLLTLLTLLAHGTRIEATPVPCPLGAGEAKVHRLVAAAPVGGWDSDGATYARGGQFRAYEVSTCPSGLSMYGADLALGLPPSLADKVRPVLAAIRTEVGGDPTEQPAWRRHRQAARIYDALDRPAEAAQLRLSAVWLARDRAVGVFEGLDGPVAAHRMLSAADTELQKDLDPGTRKQLLFNLAVVAHRGGYPARRDAFLVALGELELTPKETSRVADFREAVALEARLTAEALPAWQALAKSSTGPARSTATYLLADLLRRSGADRRARPLYAAVAGDDQAPEDVRALAQGFRDALSGVEPWSDPAPGLTRPPSFAR